MKAMYFVNPVTYDKTTKLFSADLTLALHIQLSERPQSQRISRAQRISRDLE